jgi:hypothetical protein
MASYHNGASFLIDASLNELGSNHRDVESLRFFYGNYDVLVSGFLA